MRAPVTLSRPESTVLHAFKGYGIELEYMLVDRQTLSVAPLADELLRAPGGDWATDVCRDAMGWSNELVRHLVEIKNVCPSPQIAPLVPAFQTEVREINRRLAAFDARLMPGGMHPWMDPCRETRLWHRQNADIYSAFDRIFGCSSHGWANLQSQHVNLPFADDAEFARLHAAVRLILPILPALAASSPFADGRFTGFLDYRLEVYRNNSARVPSIVGEVIPPTVKSRAEYEARLLAPMYREMAPLDPQGALHHEWLNARGAIARFDRNAIEIRLLDTQECPAADLAVAAAVTSQVRRLYHARNPAARQAVETPRLVALLLDCIRDADRAVIDDAGYLALLGFPGKRCEAGALWAYLIARMDAADVAAHGPSLQLILDQGPLARRLLAAVGERCDAERLREVYGELCDCAEEGRTFSCRAAIPC